MPHKLAALLAQTGKAPPALVDEALRRQVLAGGALDTALLEAGIGIGESELLRLVAEAAHLPAAGREGLAAADRSLAPLLPARLAERHCILPLRAEGRALRVAVAYPINRATLEEIGFLLGREIRAAVALEVRVRDAIARVYGVAVPPRHAALLAGLDGLPRSGVPQARTPPPTTPAPARRISTEKPVITPAPMPPTPIVELPTSARAPVLVAAAPQPGLARELASLANTVWADQIPGFEPMVVGDEGFGEDEDIVLTLDEVVEDGPAAPQPPAAAPVPIATPAPLSAPSTPPPAPPRPAIAAPPPPPVPRDAPRPVDRDRVAVPGLARRIATAAGGPRSEPRTLAEVRAALDLARDRHALIDTALRFALRGFDFAGAFALVGGNAVGWTAFARGVDQPARDERIERVSLPLDAPSVFRTVVLAKGQFLGPWPTDELSRGVAATLGRPDGCTTFFMPVEVRDRPIVILYSDLLRRDVPERRLGEQVLLAQHLGLCFERLILAQKRRAASSSPPTAAPGIASSPTPQGFSVVLPPPVMIPAVPTPVGFTLDAAASPVAAARTPAPIAAAPGAPQHSAARAAAAPRPAATPPATKSHAAPASAALEPLATASSPGFSLESPAPTAAELFARGPLRPREPAPAPRLDPLPVSLATPPPGVSRRATGALPESAGNPTLDSLVAAVDRLIGTDIEERARAMAELARAPEMAAAVLVARFPGPVLRARVLVAELPSADELGPVPAALARLGAPAAKALAPLLEHRDPDTRYFAVLTSGRLPNSVLLPGVAQRVFDRQATVASAARTALAAFRNVGGFKVVLEQLRLTLDHKDPEMAACAARALGRLHDIPCIDRLIQMTGSSAKVAAEAAADALREVCKQSLGLSPKRWEAWWRAHRDRPRGEWLLDGLEHRDFDVRVSAIDELVKVANDTLGYYADAGRHDRDQAVQRWRRWWDREGRMRAIA